MSDLDALADLWVQNKPMSEIGAELSMTRSKVAGLINRARKTDSRFGPPPPRVMPASKTRRVKPTGETIGNSRPLPPPPAPPRPRLLIDLGARDCKWPVGAAPDGRHLMCGLPQAAGRPYCPRHCERVSPSQPSSSSPLPRAPSRRQGFV